jgi:hypothetical protein
MSDISINWKKITRGISRGKRYANDRIPTSIFELRLNKTKKYVIIIKLIVYWLICWMIF